MLQTPEAVFADITPEEAAKYEAHFQRAKGTNDSWVEMPQMKEYCMKANLQVCSASTLAMRIIILLTCALPPRDFVPRKQTTISLRASACCAATLPGPHRGVLQRLVLTAPHSTPTRMTHSRR